MWNITSLILSEEHKLPMFESKVMWKIFGPKKVDVIVQFGILHNKGVQGLGSSRSNTKC